MDGNSLSAPPLVRSAAWMKERIGFWACVESINSKLWRQQTSLAGFIRCLAIPPRTPGCGSAESAGAVRAAGQARWNHKFELVAHLHELQPFGPAGGDLIHPNLFAFSFFN